MRKGKSGFAKIVLKDLDEALATMNEATRLGADRLGPRFIKSLLETGRQNECEEKLLGLGRSTSHWFACLPRRLKVSDPSLF